MKSSAASKAAWAWSPVQLLGDWLVAALLSLANLLVVGVLAAGALGARALDISLVAAFVAAAMFWGSVPLALMVGAVLAMVLLAVELSAATSFGAQASI